MFFVANKLPGSVSYIFYDRVKRCKNVSKSFSILVFKLVSEKQIKKLRRFLFVYCLSLRLNDRSS